jgi:iron-sulfur cluster repair protein YtfE (RIC family)
MDVIATLRNDHQTVLQRIHDVETDLLQFLHEKRTDYQQFVQNLGKWYRTHLAQHFFIEETIIFPLVKQKIAQFPMLKLQNDHELMAQEFQRFEDETDVSCSIPIVKNLVNYLEVHARTEETFFDTANLSSDELKELDMKLANYQDNPQ